MNRRLHFWGPHIWFLGPPLSWLVLFYALPLLLVVLFSFWQTINFTLVRTFTLANYANLIKPLYLDTFLRTIKVSLFATFICAVVGYPIAYYLARKVRRFRLILLMMVILPLWTSYLVRTFAWMLILGRNGIINYFLKKLGLIDESLTWLLYSDFAVTIGLVHIYLPFMILPTYAVIEKLSPDLFEAAEDLGASRLMILFCITLPLSLPGIATGCLFVFIQSVGAFVTPELLGGTRSMMIGNIIAQQFGIAYEYPFGSAMALVVMLIILIVASITLRYGRPRGVKT